MINSLIEDLIHDPHIKGLLKSFKCFHYSEDQNEEIRIKFIDLLKKITFKAYLCFGEKNIKVDEKYLKLLQKLLYGRFQKHSHNRINIHYEQSSVKPAMVEAAIKQLAKATGIPYDRLSIVKASKKEPCISIVDYISAIFLKHYESRGSENNYKQRNFSRIKHRLRLIHDYDRDIYYTWRNPFPEK